MPVVLTRHNLQELARIRLREARVLLRNGQHAGAYYLTGLAVECALKACIARKTRRYNFPNKKVVTESHTHDLTALLKVAGLEIALNREAKARREFSNNWNVVKDWKVESRYMLAGKRTARDLYAAVVGRRHGVIKWIRQNW